MKALLAALALLGLSTAAEATTVLVTSIAGGRVELLVNGTQMRKLRAGEVSPEGVRALEIGRDTALLEIDGRRWQMALGASTSTSVVLQADERGHFVVNALINGMPVRALVDTGATAVALNMRDAQRLGINLSGARPTVVSTAGGPRRAFAIQLVSVQVGDILLRDVAASISEANELPIVLLGMSFLNAVEMQRTGRTLTLTRRH